MKTCTLFEKYKNAKGYGLTKYQGRTVQAHRLHYCLANGVSLEDIKGWQVLHSCDNPSCIEPEHLRLGTHADNMQDRSDRDRCSKHEARPQSKLTQEAVKDIRDNYQWYSRTHGVGAFGKKYGVDPSTIHDALKGVNWK